MMRPWFRALARKILPGRELQTASRPGRRVRLHCEMLEDRVLMYAADFEQLELLPPAPPAQREIVSVVASETAPGQMFVAYDIVRSGEYSGAGLDQLLADLRAPGAWPSPSPSSNFYHQPESAPPPSVPPVVKPFGGTPRPDGGGGRVGPDAPAPRRGDTDVPTRPVAPPETSAPPPGGPAASPPARGDIAASPAVDLARSPDEGSNVTRPNPGPVAALATEIDPQSRTAEAGESAPGWVAVKSPAADVSDGLLLQRFVVNREQSAFTALVRRHERFVLGVCERVLGDSHAARDAVQQTFLVLARKAGVLDREGPLAGWLWTVASRQALRLRVMIARRRRKEKQAADERPSRDVAEPAAPEEQEMREALREELQRLPEKYRAPLVLCYFNGHTHEAAARALGIPRGSMAKRIAEALERLRERLRARGFTP